MDFETVEQSIIDLFSALFIPVGRVAIFVIYFWFGFLKIIDRSSATPLAMALTDKTIGAQHFHLSFIILAYFECAIGILWLIPKATRVAIPLLFAHMVIVCSPLFLVMNLAWNDPMVPTLEGQYIIKNLAIVALAMGIAAQSKSLRATRFARTADVLRQREPLAESVPEPIRESQTAV